MLSRNLVDVLLAQTLPALQTVLVILHGVGMVVGFTLECCLLFYPSSGSSLLSLHFPSITWTFLEELGDWRY